MVQLSVIVPIYNTAPYLRCCIDSILSQSFGDYELLLIDDGSTDGSGEICDEYAAEDARIRVFHQKNKGLAETRHFGLEQSMGEYIATVDSDDWVDRNYLKNMVELASLNNADMVMCAYWYHIEEDWYEQNKPTGNVPMSWVIDTLEGRCHAGLWNKLMKRNLLLSPEVLVPQYSYYEDMVMTLSYLRQCRRLIYDDRATYHYRVVSSSLTNRNDYNHRMRMYEECMKNLMAAGLQYDYVHDSELLEAFCNQANREKSRLIDATPGGKRVNVGLLKSYFPKSYKTIRIKGITTLFRYLAIAGFCLPYRLLRRRGRQICKNS